MNVPGTGYVGVAEVLEEAVPITVFEVPADGGILRPIIDVVTGLPNPDVADELKEHYVRVRWIYAVDLANAVRERGFFGNRNTVARPQDKKWAHTVERLKQRFTLGD